MSKRMAIAMMLAAALLLALSALAHFAVVQPSDDIVAAGDSKTIKVDLRFGHPFEQGLMNMVKPQQFGVLAGGEKQDLLSSLQLVKQGDFSTWSTEYQIGRPGDYVFYLEPTPYWEPAEGKLIIHYTKVVVQALGLEEGWDELLGFPIEIRPLTRPYGLWTGNVFSGQVLLEGKPVPFAEVEVSYDNKDKIPSPDEVYCIQVVIADQNGVFSYAMPRAGWWGFAALEDGPEQLLAPDGEKHPVEIGGLIWVNTVDFK